MKKMMIAVLAVAILAVAGIASATVTVDQSAVTGGAVAIVAQSGAAASLHDPLPPAVQRRRGADPSRG